MAGTTFVRGSAADSREELAGASLSSGKLSSTRCSVDSSNHSRRSRNGSPRAFSLSLFLFCFWFYSGSRDGSLRTLSMPFVLSLLVDAGCCAGTTPSCDNHVGDVGVAELEEPVDKPETTVGTKFAVLHFIRLPSLMSCGF